MNMIVKMLRPPNTDGWGNKLVTIFARHLDNFILTLNFSLICQIRDFGSGQILQPRLLYLSPGLAKIAPWWLVCRERFVHPPSLPFGKLRGCFGGRSRDSCRRPSPPTFTTYTSRPLYVRCSNPDY